VLLLLTFNLFPLLQTLKLGETISLFGAVLALLGSPIIGFLVSQLWWWWFQGTLELWKWRPIKALIKKYSLTDSREADGKKKVLVIYDYILHSGVHSDVGKKGISNYTHARWDMYILLSCTKLSLELGIAVGALGRLMSEYFVFHVMFWQNAVSYFQTFWKGAEFWVLAFILVGTLILIVSIRHGQDWIRFEYDGIHEIIIAESEVKPEDFKRLMDILNQDDPKIEYKIPKVTE